MSYPEFSDFPPIPQRSAAEADFDTKMSALFQHFATTHRAELIALIDFLKTNSTIIGGALNATTVGLDAPAEGKFTALEAPQLDLVNTVSGVLAVLGASASDLNIGTNSNHPVDLRVAGIRSILLSTNGTKSFYQTDGSTVGVTIDGSGNVNTAGFLAVGRDYAFSPLDVENGALVSSGDVADDRRGTIHLQNVGGTPADGALAVGISFSGVNTRRRRALIASYQDGEDGDPTGLRARFETN
ncbi:hypothetical protein AAFO90_17310 [Phaeobacter sp. CAU 1743]|uniref:hypothetical protein n=1 Tax=Phaeobacter sp. CAU 1743 TaxID=3140367 RepID=UPI00325B3AD9